MDFYMKLPRNKKEFTLFIAIISVISVMIIAPIITCFEFGFHVSVWQGAMQVVPIIWFSVVAFVLLTYRPAECLTSKFTHKDDSFSATILVILCTVFLMSVLLT